MAIEQGVRPDAHTEKQAPKRSHFRKYGIIYGVVALVAVLVVVFPSVSGDDGEPDRAKTAATGDTDTSAWKPASGTVKVGEGTTVGGEQCEPGRGQIPDTAYAVPCVAAFTGDNGGATYRGVTADTIRIVRRSFPSSANSQAADAQTQAAGFATDEDSDRIRDRFIGYFESKYELYGRKIEWVEYESKFSNGTKEALGQGREGACADVTHIVKELNAFAATGGSGNFAECAAEQGLLVFSGAPYFSETFFQKHHPFVWNTSMECERISSHVAEYVGKRLAGKPAKHAGSPDLQAATRTFGTYVPDNDEYQGCTKLTEKVLREDYGVEPTARYNYQLDISRMQQQALEGVIQFKAAGVTTVILASDPFSVLFLTQAAEQQDYHPEWLLIGVAGQDTDNFGRQYQKNQVEGHMFGLSQLSDNSKVFGPASEPGKLWKKLSGEEIPKGTTGAMYPYVHIFNFLQAAGPDLTPDNIAKGVQTLPDLGGDDGALGVWRFTKGPLGEDTGDHTAGDDAREIYWDPTATAVDAPGKVGRWVETYNGKRFLNGEWPAEDPPVYGDAK